MSNDFIPKKFSENYGKFRKRGAGRRKFITEALEFKTIDLFVSIS